MKRLVIVGMVWMALLGACAADKGKELFDTAQKP